MRRRTIRRFRTRPRPFRSPASGWLAGTARAIGTLTADCADAGAPGSTTGTGEIPEFTWENLRHARPEALSRTTRITVARARTDLLGDGRWSEGSGASADLGLQKLISVNLLRRRDVHFVERRRFSVWAERERRGAQRPENAPPVGTSPGADLNLTASWVPTAPDSAVLDLRLTDARSEKDRRDWRPGSPASATLPPLARLAAGGLLRSLDELGRRPEWEDRLPDSVADAAPGEDRPTGVPAAVSAFRAGVAAEDRYDWSAAFRTYTRAVDRSGDDLFEPEVALARTTRLRAGGTPGQSP